MKINNYDVNFGYLILRVGLGLTFFMAGLNKLMNYSGSVAYLKSGFAESWLPDFMVAGFAYPLPFIELGLGFLLVVGLLTRPALYFTGIVMLALNFGLLVNGDYQGVGRNIVYIVLIALDIILINYNKYSLDQLLFGSLSDD